ncbi:MAG: hypothetical protein GF335_01195 [Candidatus Moranbacteria bacterium]|nr:hypothetical protein [Candidatus Moranbacteria bacterium]
MTPKYKSEMSVLFIQKQLSSIDVYTASKSAERISLSFKNIIYSSKFLNLILNNQEIDKTYFIDKRTNRISLEKWEDSIKLNNIRESGILEIEIFHPDKNQAKLISNQVLVTLEKDGATFHGGGNNVNIMRLDDPETSLEPAYPNIPLNSALGLMTGIIVGVMIVYLKSDSSLNNLEKKEKNIVDSVDADFQKETLSLDQKKTKLMKGSYNPPDDKLVEVQSRYQQLLNNL